jgi:hypothetical protein
MLYRSHNNILQRDSLGLFDHHDINECQRGLGIGICCFSAKEAALRRKSKDWLARNQNNVSEWSDMSTCCFSELAL